MLCTKSELRFLQRLEDAEGEDGSDDPGLELADLSDLPDDEVVEMFLSARAEMERRGLLQ